MPKKRRKLNKDFEKKIYTSKKNVELVLAKIYDIDDEDIQKEYMSAFNHVVYSYDQLKNDYELTGFNDNSGKLIADYNKAFSLFESEFEI
jgi:glutamate mutase epsilon subunit